MDFLYSVILCNKIMNKTLLSVTAIIAAVAMIGSLGAFASSVYAASACGSGNPHGGDGDEIIKYNPQGKPVGNPHDSDDGLSTGNPHCK